MADPISLGALALSAVGTVMTYQGQRQAGAAAQAEANYRAEQGKVNAGQERAAAQRRAQEARRQKNLAQSRAQALAAAGGGGTLDPSIINYTGDIETEGELDALNALYEGNDRARQLEMGADIARWEGKQAKKSSNMAATGTLVSGVGSMFDKYNDYQFKKSLTK